MPQGKDAFHWIALKTVLIIFLVFVLQNIIPELTGAFSLKKDFWTQPWTALTYIFLHGSFTHLFSNAFSLFIFGSMLEKIVGYRNFLTVFFVTGVLSGVLGVLFYDSVIGASGSAFGIMGVLGLLRPKMVVWALGVPMYMTVAIIVYAVLDMAGLFFPSNIAHIGHISALVMGIVIGLLWKKRYGIVETPKENKIAIGEQELRKWEEEYMIPKKKRS